MRNTRARRNRTVTLLAAGLLAFLRLWLASGQGVIADPLNGFDDRLYVNMALHLLTGEWLGPYTVGTLIRGPFYPMWIAAVFPTGVPLLWAQNALYALACGVAVLALRPVLANRWLRVAVFGLLLFNPIGFAPVVAQRLLREGIYPTLTLFVLGTAIGLLVRHNRSPARLALWSVGLGAALGSFWLTREEGVWLVPVVGALLAWAVYRVARPGSPWVPLKVSLCLLPAALCAITVWSVAQVNRLHYGVAVVTEIQAVPFRAAYGALARVTQEAPEPSVPVPAETRRRIYPVSPAFAELQPWLEGDVGRTWTAAGCTLGRSCSDISGGWFLWALREAAARAGHHASAEAAADFYTRLAREVNDACAAGGLACGPKRATLRPPWRAAQMGPFLAAAAEGAVAVARFAEVGLPTSASYGSVKGQELFHQLAHDRTPIPREHLVVGAWGFSPRGPLEVAVRTAKGAPAEAAVTRLDTPDVYARALAQGVDLPALKRAALRIDTPCIVGCVLEVRAGGEVAGEVPLDGTPQALSSGDATLRVVSTQRRIVAAPLSALARAQAGALGAVAAVYRALLPGLVPLALAAWAFMTWHHARRRRLPLTWVIQSALLLAVASRVALMALVHVTSFPAIQTRYLAPAHPALLLFVALAVAEAARALKGALRLRRARSRAVSPG